MDLVILGVPWERATTRPINRLVKGLGSAAGSDFQGVSRAPIRNSWRCARGRRTYVERSYGKRSGQCFILRASILPASLGDASGTRHSTHATAIENGHSIVIE